MAMDEAIHTEYWLLPRVRAIVLASWKRGQSWEFSETCGQH